MSIYGETPTGLVNSSNKIFTTANVYFAGSTRVFVNGIRKDLGVDYTEATTTTISFGTAPTTGQTILIDYDLIFAGGNYPVGEWTFNPDGSAVFSGPQLFPAGISPGTTNTGVVVYGPGGAKANFPAVGIGEPGPPATLSFTSTQIPSGTTPGNPTVVNSAPGVYALDLKLQEGATGPAGPNSVLAASDVEGTPLQGYGLFYQTADTKAKWLAPKVGPIYEVFSFSSTSSASTAQRVLSSITIAAQPWDWWPEVEGQCVVTNAVDTRVDLIAYIGSVSGQIAGRGYGAGNGVGTVTQVLQGAFGSDMPGGSGYGVVAAGSSATLILRAENQVSSSNSWATGSGSFKVKVCPVP